MKFEKVEIPTVESIVKEMAKRLGATEEQEKTLIDISNILLEEMTKDLIDNHHPLGPKLGSECH